MASKVNRVTVDLSAYPDLVVIYLGMRVNRLRGMKTVFSFGPRIGLLLHENLILSLFPLHVGMRQYWRDFESLEAWARSMPHQKWWTDFIRDSGGTGFWHETYFKHGGIEAIYDDIPSPLGLAKFAPTQPARGAMFSARRRLQLEGEARVKGPVSEEDLG